MKTDALQLPGLEIPVQHLLEGGLVPGLGQPHREHEEAAAPQRVPVVFDEGNALDEPVVHAAAKDDGLILRQLLHHRLPPGDQFDAAVLGKPLRVFPGASVPAAVNDYSFLPHG